MVHVALSPSADRGFPRAVVLLWGGAGAVIVVAGLRSAAGLVAPLMLALVITITVQPLRSQACVVAADQRHRGEVPRQGHDGWQPSRPGVLR